MSRSVAHFRAGLITICASVSRADSFRRTGPSARDRRRVPSLGIGVTAYGVLSRGLLSGSRPAAQGDFRSWLPRFSGANLEHNRQLVTKLRELAEAKGVTRTQLVIAWVLAKSESIVPLIGAHTRAQLDESLRALDVKRAH